MLTEDRIQSLFGEADQSFRGERDGAVQTLLPSDMSTISDMFVLIWTYSNCYKIDTSNAWFRWIVYIPSFDVSCQVSRAILFRAFWCTSMKLHHRL